MNVSIDDKSSKIIKAELTGRMTVNQWRASLEKVAELLKPGQVTPLLVDARTFAGFGSGEWDNFSFQVFQKEHDPMMGRMAIVADPKWEDRAMLFAGEGLRAIEIRFFPSADIDRARRWLVSPGTGSPGSQPTERDGR